MVTLPVRHFEGYVVSHRAIREEVDTSPSIPRRQPQLPCDSHGLRLRPSNIPDLTLTDATLSHNERIPYTRGVCGSGSFQIVLVCK